MHLSRETLLNLEKNDLPAVAGGVEADAPSVKFCTDACTTTTGG